MESSQFPPSIPDYQESMVDSFLVEALQNPRHRLTILWMELDIQKFLQSPEQQQFEFQHFPTSYLRLAAHRVAQHYGLMTTVHDNGIDGQVNKIVVKKTGESRYPAVCLSVVSAKQYESDQPEKVKIAMRPQGNKGINEFNEFGIKRSPVRTMEERQEEYDRARARIFSSPSSPDADDSVFVARMDSRNLGQWKDPNESLCNNTVDPRDGSSRVAIFRDREKDRIDPDYDRSYERYVRSLSHNQGFGVAPPFNMQNVQLSYFQFDPCFPQLAHMPRTQASLGYRPTGRLVMSPYCAMESSQTSLDGAYAQWETPAMMYAHPYDQFRHAAFQAPFFQKPLSFDYIQHH